MECPDFFKALYVENKPTGKLGRGTHYSVLRAVTWHDQDKRPLSRAAVQDFSIIWDEDHDDRIMEAITAIYIKGLLPGMVFIGERKGCFSAVLADEVYDSLGVSGRESLLNDLSDSLHLDEDVWCPFLSRFSNLAQDEGSSHSIINDSEDNVLLYLKNINMLWSLGIKSHNR